MITSEAIIQSPSGLHARSAKELVKIVNKYQSDVFLNYQDSIADAASISQIMRLFVPQNGRVRISVHGKDEQQVSQEITHFLCTFAD